MRTAVEKSASSLRVAYWAVQLGGWGWHFWWQASGEAIFAAVPFSEAASVWGGVCMTGIVTTDLLRRLSKQREWLKLPTRALLVRLTLSVVVLTMIGSVVMIALSIVVYGSPVAAMFQAFYRKLPLSTQLFNQLLGALLTYLTWIAGYFSIALIRQRYRLELQQARLSESLQAAELQLLKSQLNPHFLFNALNGVRALIADEPTRAQDAVTQLARTLRYTLESGREEFVTLARELEMVNDYLALESLRLAQRLRIVRDIEPQATVTRIPVMLVQALVENAIKHGIAPLREGGTLRISARIVDKQLEIEVENPRPTQSNTEPSAGVGLKNTERRLELLFGARASIHLDLSDARRAKANVRLPT
jgi:sensor histidine kinase YesM